MGKRNFAHKRNRIAWQTLEGRQMYNRSARPQPLGDGRTPSATSDKPPQPPRKPKEGDSD